MNVLHLLTILSLSLAAGVQAQVNSDLCSLSIQAIEECQALQCPLEVANGECSLPTGVTSCSEAEEVCLAVSSCCGGGCGVELEAVVDNCIPDLGCGDISCTPEETSTSTFAQCENATIIDVCDNLNRTCAQQTDADGTNSREFCDQCKNGTIWNFVSDVVGDCYPIEAITYEEFLAYFNPLFKDDLAPEVRAQLLKAVALVVSAHNSQFPRPDFFLRINSLAGLSDAEIRFRNGLRNATEGEDKLGLLDFSDGTRRLQGPPASVDWSKTGAVTRVKDQGQCGCCWSVATVGAIEAAVWLTSDGAFQDDLSWQQLISCNKQNSGCNGGNVVNALTYTEDENIIGGLTSLADYPFSDKKGVTTQDCQVADKQLEVDVVNTGLAVSSTSPSNANDRVTKIKEALAETPMAVLMSASCNTFQAYHKGIMTDDGGCACNSGSCIDHAVLMVGYDDTTNPPSFKFKNSWGTSWGENGYFRIAQTVDQDTMEYGLFGLLYQGSGSTNALNTTVFIPSAATSIQAGSLTTATALTVISGVVLGFGIGW